MWRSLAWEALDCPFGLVVGVSITVLVAVSIGLAVTFVIAIPLAWFTFLVAAQFGRIERSRAAALLGVNLASPHAPFAPGNWWSRLRQQVTTASRWREIGYLSLGLPIQAVMGAAVLVLWSAAFALAALPAYVTHLPGQSADLGAFRVHQGLGAATAAIIGVLILLVVAPQTTVALRCPRSEACAVAARSRVHRRTLLAVSMNSSSAAVRRSAARRRNDIASSGTSTMAPSSDWSRWPWTSDGRESVSTPNPKVLGSW